MANNSKSKEPELVIIKMNSPSPEAVANFNALLYKKFCSILREEAEAKELANSQLVNNM